MTVPSVNAVSTVAVAPSPASSGTSLTVATGDGSRFPGPTSSAAVGPAFTNPTSDNVEVVAITGISGDTLTITRAQEGTSARAITAGDRIYCPPDTYPELTAIEQRVPAVLFDHYADLADSGSGTEVALYSDTVPAGALAVNGDKLHVWYAGQTTAHASNTRTLKVYFAAVTAQLQTDAFTSSSVNRWYANLEIIRVSATQVRLSGSIIRAVQGAAGVCYAWSGQVSVNNLGSEPPNLKITGTSSGTGAGITAQSGSAYLLRAA